MASKDPLVRAATSLRWSKTPKGIAYRKAYRHSHPQLKVKRTSHLRKRYGITDADYYKLLAHQNGKCAVCYTDNPGTKTAQFWDVDHCHTTNKVRGLLCRNCNTTLGVLENKRELLMKLEAYLVRYA